MNKLTRFILPLLLFSTHVFCQADADKILMTIHDRQVTVDEFERIYNKNNSSTALEQQTVEEYLDLFINFKLKVIEAEEMGLDTTQRFIKEFNGYKEQLAKPYLSDEEEVEALVREAFERAQIDINASHILIRANAEAPPEDTLRAYNKALEIRDRILAGEDFGTVAKATSDDPSAKTNAGLLGWFNVFRMVYPFENGAYQTEKGKLSLPVRTRFGYHLIKVNNIRPARGNVRVSHIMIMTPESMNEEKRRDAKNKILKLYDSIQAGMDFSEMARRYSEDRGSATRGGELPLFGTGRMVAPFEEASFALANIGDISEPVQTSFGWHIIKLLEQKKFDDFETVQADLRANVTKSDRNAYSKIALVERIKRNNNFTENRESLYPFYSVVDTSIYYRNWDVGKAAGLNEVLFTIGDRSVTQQDFASYLAEKQGTNKTNIQVLVDNHYEKFTEVEVLQYEEDQLPGKYPEFKHLIQEYHDGILLFDLTDQMVWTKAVEDSVGLEAFYAGNKSNYMWGKRLDAALVTCRDAEVATFAREQLSKKKRKRPSLEGLQSLAYAEFSDSSCLSFEFNTYEMEDHPLIEKMDWNEPMSGNMEEDGKVIFVVKNRILKPEPKLLDECRGIVTADYQNHLETEWIESLRAKYTVQVNQEMLSEIN
jgi:peptidyl-prolyl cis-trans isomerase SurA